MRFHIIKTINMITINDQVKKILADKTKDYNTILNKKGLYIKIEAKKYISSTGKENVIEIVIIKSDKEPSKLSQLEYCNADKTSALIHLTGVRDEPLEKEYDFKALFWLIPSIKKFRNCKVNTIDDIFKEIDKIIF